jgi:hypothetical protein
VRACEAVVACVRARLWSRACVRGCGRVRESDAAHACRLCSRAGGCLRMRVSEAARARARACVRARALCLRDGKHRARVLSDGAPPPRPGRASSRREIPSTRAGLGRSGPAPLRVGGRARARDSPGPAGPARRQLDPARPRAGAPAARRRATAVPPRRPSPAPQTLRRDPGQPGRLGRRRRATDSPLGRGFLRTGPPGPSEGPSAPP